VDWENDKPTVVALREIAAGLVTPEMLEKEVESAADLPGYAEAAAAFAALHTGAAGEGPGGAAGEGQASAGGGGTADAPEEGGGA